LLLCAGYSRRRYWSGGPLSLIKNQPANSKNCSN
jgi:hypothetical protein